MQSIKKNSEFLIGLYFIKGKFKRTIFIRMNSFVGNWVWLGDGNDVKLRDGVFGSDDDGDRICVRDIIGTRLCVGYGVSVRRHRGGFQAAPRQPRAAA
jgi:hypothetical protein